MAFVYLDTENEFVRWNIASGRINSATFIKHSTNHDAVTPFFKGVVSNMERYNLERKLEATRQTNHVDKNSRLTSAYFFDDLLSARAAEGTTKYFTKGNLFEVNVSNMALCSKHDMNWISYFFDCKDKYPQNWMDLYWDGEPCPYSQRGVPVYENLTNGFLMLNDLQAPNKFYWDLIQECTDYSFLLTFAVLAAKLNSVSGSMFYNLISEHGCIQIVPSIDFRENELISIFNLGEILYPHLTDRIRIWQNLSRCPDLLHKGYCLSCATSLPNCKNYKKLKENI